MTPPLPLAPRPHRDEALSSWVRRIGARYDILGDDLVEHLLDQPGRALGGVGTLDYRAAPVLEAALAGATRMPVAVIRNLRIAGHDGRNACWHRDESAWCPMCIQADLARHGEPFERAIWRLGCCVMCPEHNVPLEDTCRRCPFEDRCHFTCAGGLLGRACNSCKRLVGLEARRTAAWWEDESVGAFGVRITPSLDRLVAALQSDLLAAFTGAPPTRSWGFLRSAQGLESATLRMTFCLLLATGVRWAPRIILPQPAQGEAVTPAADRITPARLSAWTAYGVLAIAAAVLRSLEGEEERHAWAPDGSRLALTVGSFLACLPANVRHRLRSWSVGWDRPAGEALRAAIAEVEDVR